MKTIIRISQDNAFYDHKIKTVFLNKNKINLNFSNAFQRYRFCKNWFHLVFVFFKFRFLLLLELNFSICRTTSFYREYENGKDSLDERINLLTSLSAKRSEREFWLTHRLLLMIAYHATKSSRLNTSTTPIYTHKSIYESLHWSRLCVRCFSTRPSECDENVHWSLCIDHITERVGIT